MNESFCDLLRLVILTKVAQAKVAQIRGTLERPHPLTIPNAVSSQSIASFSGVVPIVGLLWLVLRWRVCHPQPEVCYVAIMAIHVEVTALGLRSDRIRGAFRGASISEPISPAQIQDRRHRTTGVDNYGCSKCLGRRCAERQHRLRASLRQRPARSKAGGEARHAVQRWLHQ